MISYIMFGGAHFNYLPKDPLFYESTRIYNVSNVNGAFWKQLAVTRAIAAAVISPAVEGCVIGPHILLYYVCSCLVLLPNIIASWEWNLW